MAMPNEAKTAESRGPIHRKSFLEMVWRFVATLKTVKAAILTRSN